MKTDVFFFFFAVTHLEKWQRLSRQSREEPVNNVEFYEEIQQVRSPILLGYIVFSWYTFLHEVNVKANGPINQGQVCVTGVIPPQQCSLVSLMCSLYLLSCIVLAVVGVIRERNPSLGRAFIQ